MSVGCQITDSCRLHCVEVTDAPTTLGPGWEGGHNSGSTVWLSVVGHVSQAASETYSQPGHRK